jgi:hypothetical protein
MRKSDARRSLPARSLERGATGFIAWEDANSFAACFPHFQLEHELLLEGGEMSCGATTTTAVGLGPWPVVPATTSRKWLSILLGLDLVC